MAAAMNQCAPMDRAREVQVLVPVRHLGTEEWSERVHQLSHHGKKIAEPLRPEVLEMTRGVLVKLFKKLDSGEVLLTTPVMQKGVEKEVECFTGNLQIALEVSVIGRFEQQP